MKNQNTRMCKIELCYMVFRCLSEFLLAEYDPHYRYSSEFCIVVLGMLVEAVVSQSPQAELPIKSYQDLTSKIACI